MKRQILLALVLGCSLTAFSQKTHHVMGWKISKDIPKNEVKLNLMSSIFWSYPEISYERIMHEDFSWGLSLGAGLDEDTYPVKVALQPYARWFFGGSSHNLQKYGAGFFIEANGGLWAYSDDVWGYGGNPQTETKAGVGLGVASGWKYLSKNNWVGEFYMGFGRDFAGDSFYPRVGLTIGRRF